MRILAYVIVTITLLFVFNNYLIFWLDWPGTITFLQHKQWFGFGPRDTKLEGSEVTLGWLQFLSYTGSIVYVIAFVVLTPTKSLRAEAEFLSSIAAYTMRAAFWSVLLIGLAEIVISFLRADEFLELTVAKELTTELGRARFRNAYVHLPIILLSLVIAYFVRSLSFMPLAVLIFIAELLTFVSHSVFSHEQVLTDGLVRTWYATLFLFTVSYSLIHDGRVRVARFYRRFSTRKKAQTHVLGTVLLGLPLCWAVLSTGLWRKDSSLNNPLLSFEIQQSDFIMYAKYMFAGFLVVFTVSMTIQLMSYFLDNVATLCGERDGE